MKIFGKEFKFNGFDIWHKGNFSPPTSLPANGGNSDTVDNKHASDFALLEGVSGSWRVGEIIHNVARCLITSTPTEILIKTGIPFISSSHMPVIHIQGYAYGVQSPIELKIGYYVYGNAHGWCGAVSMGAWRPTIKLFTYLGADGVTKYTGIALIGSIYYPQFSVSVQTEFGGNYPNGWSIENNSANNTVYNMPNTDVVTVPYKPTFSQTINGVTFDGTSNITITANPNTHTHAKSQITDMPTKLSDFTNDIGAGGGVKITTSTTAPTGPSPGDFWYKEL